MADAREIAGAVRSPIEIDRFEHVLASPERALLRLDGRYSETPGARTLEAVLVVDDGETVRRHLALPDPNRLDPSFVEEDHRRWARAYLVMVRALVTDGYGVIAEQILWTDGHVIDCQELLGDLEGHVNKALFARRSNGGGSPMPCRRICAARRSRAGSPPARRWRSAWR